MDSVNAKKELSRQLWLAYYNKVLRDRGIITEREYRKMRVLIYQTPSHEYQ